MLPSDHTIRRKFSKEHQKNDSSSPKRQGLLQDPRYLNALELEKLKISAETLRQEISKTIDKEGPISFQRYMEMALTHNPEGYYMKRDVFNKKGDFITSPEIS